MNSWGAIVCLAAFAGVQQVLAEDLAFPENARGLINSRIVSGWEAAEGQIPWQLSVRMVNPVGSVSSCGGSIIHPEWGLTAAHCTATRVTLVLRAGAVSLLRPELIFETTEYYNHPLYIDALQSIVQPHDISILKFQRTIIFSERVQPIRIQRSEDKNRNYEGVRLVASGWGRTWTDGNSPENLQWVYLLGDSNQFCWATYGQSSTIVDSTICASAYNVSSQSTCQGDSGGPLVELEEDGKYSLVGVTSFVSSSGCHTAFPAGFIRPGHYHDWITQVTGINFDWVPEEPASSSEESSEKSSEEKSGEEKPSEEKSGEEKPSEEKSAEEKPSEEKSGEETPSEEKSGEEKPSEEQSGEEKPSEEKSGEERPSEEKSGEEKPSEEKSGEEKPSEEKSGEEKPSQEKSGEEKSSEEKFSEEKPSEEKSSEEKPSEEKSGEEKPSQEKSGEEKPSEEKSGEEKPSEEKSGEEKPSEEKSGEEKPSEEKSGEEKPSEEKSGEEKPSEEKSGEEKPSQEKSGEEKPSEEKSGEEKPSQEKSSEDAASEEAASEEEQSRLFFSLFRRDFGRVLNVK